MNPMTTRVACLQFATGMDPDENLATCLRMIDEAGASRPDIMVLPEFCNYTPWYRDRHHAYDMAVALDGPFLTAIAGRARRHGAYIMVNVTIRRPQKVVSGSSILLGPDGNRIGIADKQVLAGMENLFLKRARYNSRVYALPVGRVGMFSDADSFLNETARSLALRGAQILLNSLSSYAEDETTLHIPARAAENKVFVAAANKVGPLVPAAQKTLIAGLLDLTPEQLEGAGGSQIVDPTGRVLALAPAAGEAVIYADIDLQQADRKERPDGTDIFAVRRPPLYGSISQPPRVRHYAAGAEQVQVAVLQPRSGSTALVEDAIDGLSATIPSADSLLALPELFYLPGGKVDDPREACDLGQQAVEQLRQALAAQQSDLVVATSVVERSGSGWAHMGVLLNRKGVVLRQPQLHDTARHPWVTALGESLGFSDLGWGRIGLVVGGDAIFPESFRLAALRDIEVVLVITHLQESWESSVGLVERAAENRISLVVASRPTAAGASALISFAPVDHGLGGDTRATVNQPSVQRAAADTRLLQGLIYPNASANRKIALQTDVLASRPWWLTEAITQVVFEGVAPL